MSPASPAPGGHPASGAYARPWALLMGGKQLFSEPRSAVLRRMVFNHIIHHRGQLTLYLRLLNVPVPGLYGPSADEQTSF